MRFSATIIFNKLRIKKINALIALLKVIGIQNNMYSIIFLYSMFDKLNQNCIIFTYFFCFLFTYDLILFYHKMI